MGNSLGLTKESHLRSQPNKETRIKQNNFKENQQV